MNSSKETTDIIKTPIKIAEEICKSIENEEDKKNCIRQFTLYTECIRNIEK